MNNDEFGVMTVDEKIGVVVSKPRRRGGRTSLPPTVSKIKKRVRMNSTPKEKLIEDVLNKAGVSSLPTLDSMLEGANGTRMKISEIGLFIDVPRASILQDVYAKCSIKNRVNLSARITLRHVKKVGVDLLTAGKMFMPICVANIENEDGTTTSECWSGRHRLVFFALVYGPDVEVPVDIRDMSLTETRDAVVFANQARKTRVLEKAEHRVLKAINGDMNLGRDEIYNHSVVKKSDVASFCVYSVIDARMHGGKLNFDVSKEGSRKDGLTTVGNLQGFWKRAIRWDKTMDRVRFDEQLRKTVSFLNDLVDKMIQHPDFQSRHHLAAKVLNAIGRYYASVEVAGMDSLEVVDEIVEAVVGMGEIGSHKADETYNKLVVEMGK